MSIISQCFLNPTVHFYTETNTCHGGMCTRSSQTNRSMEEVGVHDVLHIAEELLQVDRYYDRNSLFC